MADTTDSVDVDHPNVALVTENVILFGVVLELLLFVTELNIVDFAVVSAVEEDKVDIYGTENDREDVGVVAVETVDDIDVVAVEEVDADDVVV